MNKIIFHPVSIVLAMVLGVVIGCAASPNNASMRTYGSYTEGSTLSPSHAVTEAEQIIETQQNKARIRVWEHHGGKPLNHEHIRETIHVILTELPNMRSVPHITDLILETLIVESTAGAASYTHAAKRWKNYGIAQFTKSSAKDTMNWTKRNHPKTYRVMMKYYNNKKSLVDNLMSNVPFCIALVSQYYLQRTKNKLSRQHLNTLVQRAHVWNHVYNTAAGKGTPTVYIKRVNTYYAKNKRRK